jgi:outer membrane protein assembly factor BamB
VAHLDYLGNAIASRATEGDSPEVNPVVSGRGRIIFPRAASSTRFKIVVPSLWADHAVSGTFSVPPGHGFAAAAEDILYTAAGTELIAVDDTGDTLWRYDISVDPVTGEPTGVTGGLSTPPVVDAQGNILFGNADGLVFAIAPDGAPLWSFATAGAIAAVPAIGADGTVYAVSADASLYALTPQGSLLWSLPLGATVSTSPVIGVDSTIYVATDDGRLYAVGPDGAMSWSLELEATIRSDPVIGADNRIYIGAGDGEFYAVDPDGGIAWQASLGAPVSPGSPFIDNQGVLYVATQDNKVQGLYAGARGLADSPWPTVSHDMHRSGNVATRLRTADAIP